jgi:hypothetical protein
MEAAGAVDAQNGAHSSLETTERFPQLPQVLIIVMNKTEEPKALTCPRNRGSLSGTIRFAFSPAKPKLVILARAKAWCFRG